ncbi:hypothetical protein LL033_09995 [Clostridium estertheticum]|uniref:hypothetical protein n=1 Tax=Clostridium estertheticum TaxID=238834 RepID=UPI00227A5AC4|nr:hypothetical protein [Clostridium estertheticum]WAG57487.1 hypothetical protein LL033_09995 [Clostridium estertheticum]
MISHLTGVATVEDVGKSKSAGLEGLRDYGKETRKGAKINLLNSDEELAYHYENSIMKTMDQIPKMKILL